MEHRRRRGPVAALVLLLSLVACGQAPDLAVHPEIPAATADIVAGCCVQAEVYPDWLIDIATANIDTVREIGLIQFRPGRLTHHPEAEAILVAALRPLDILFVHSRNRMSAALIPGHFTHGAIYLGTEAQLRDAGLWHLRALDPVRDQIRAGELYLEAVDGGVRLAGPGIVLDTDGVVVLRPRATPGAVALTRGLALMGTPFDMNFDSADNTSLFCSELLALTFAETQVPRARVYGRETILPDAVVAGVLSNTVAFDLVGYVETSPRGGARALTTRDLAWRLRAAWPSQGR